MSASVAGGPANAGIAASMSSGRSAISGTVLLDEKVDGKSGRGNRPVVGITVSIGGPGLNTATTTGSSGGFVFDGLPAGSYVVSIAVPAGMASPSGTSRQVTVDGRISVRADFLIVRPEQAPTPTAIPPTPTPIPPTSTPIGPPTPLPTPTPQPTSTPIPAALDAAPLGPDSAATSGAERQRGASAASAAPGPPIVTQYGPRYAPGRGNPNAIQPVRTDRSLWLGVPFITQLDGSPYSPVNCGPASTAMVLAAFGIRTSPDLIRNYVNHLSGAYSQTIGTSLDHLGRVLRESGLEVTNLHSGSGYLRWSTALVREEILAGHPVITLVKYRSLPGHTGSAANFDHYIVIAGLAGDDFIYNDAAYTGDRGYGLLISPADLERAWDYSSIPRHGLAVGLSAPSSAAEPPDTLAQLDLGDDLSEALLASDRVDPGRVLRLQGDYGALSFQRLDLGGAPIVLQEDAAAVTLELASFVAPEVERSGVLSDLENAAARSAPPQVASPDPASEESPLKSLLSWLLLGVVAPSLILLRWFRPAGLRYPCTVRRSRRGLGFPSVRVLAAWARVRPRSIPIGLPLPVHRSPDTG